MQTNGSLAQTSLASLLEAMQAERATGTLSVRRGASGCSLYFLFGHLFHATGDLGQGEDAVISALTWPDGQFTFDPRAKLPAEETIKAATADLLSAAQRRAHELPTNGSGRVMPSVAAVAAPLPLERPAPLPMERPAPLPLDRPAPVPLERSAPLPLERAAPLPMERPAPPPQPPMAPVTPYVPPAPQAPAAAAAPPQPAPSSWAAEAEPEPDRRMEAPPLSSAAATATFRPAQNQGQVYGNPNASPLGELYPLPSGKPIYEGLKSAFVDFPKLLRTLDGDKLTGYVRLDGADFSGVLLLHDGHVLDALFSDGIIAQGLDAFQKLRVRMERGEGLLDVIELSGETVVSLAQLLTAPPLFTGLLARFVNFGALLEYLGEERVDGSLLISGGTETGVILLRKGAILGAYTQSHRTLSTTPGAVTALANERTARIEVKSGTSASPEGIDVDAALRVVY
ncbi:MAG TPA: DUF4388 domain-containing protein [Candidatus Dormibacteraeota bacterium]|nr:DUF4388 domain-containing protein [Candidatus Dormibacteraeota bacterium]